MHALIRDLLQRYDDDTWEGDVVPAGCTPPEGAFVIARSAGRAIACGGFTPFGEPGIAELKRMYVDPVGRGRGVARALLGHLESRALAAGYRLLCLAAGTKQPEALRLYERAGYAVAERGWGTWADDPLSVFLEKPLGTHAPGAATR
ncbi:GNAT family N-acetyltransferase [soil metagenome]|nr:GNAT family N-acetyltransferase [Trueperaceae bacterium]